MGQAAARFARRPIGPRGERTGIQGSRASEARGCQTDGVVSARNGDGLSDDVELALRLADRAAEIARPHFEVGVTSRAKADGSPVTAADLAVEDELVRMLGAERPSDAVLSEEAGSSGHSHRRWLIDPIDGTEKFLAKDSCWGTHIALEIDGSVAVGVMTRPVQRLRWWAALGLGAHRSEEGTARSEAHLQVSRVSTLEASRITVWAEGPSQVADALATQANLVEPGYDDYIDLIEGRLDAIVFPRPGVAFAWDHAPAVILAAEAGGRFRDPSGGARFESGSGVFSNGLIDPELDRAIAQFIRT